MKVSYPLLTAEQKAKVNQRLEVRKNRYLSALSGNVDVKNSILIIGDRPGPSAPKIAGYHHTPFYSTKHCSGWLNAYLELEGIDENDLTWINAYDVNNEPTDPRVITKVDPRVIIALGGNADKWAKAAGVDLVSYKYVKLPHPQWHKRFMNSQPYDLVEVLKCCSLLKAASCTTCTVNVCPMYQPAP